MTTRFATPQEINEWNGHIARNPDGGNVFQLQESALVKQSVGWEPRYIIADDKAILALERKIPFLGRFWYLPKGPSISSSAELKTILPEVRELAATSGVFAIKIEPELTKNPATTQELLAVGLRPSFAVQPNSSTVLIDLAPSLDDVLASFNQKGRHALRRAERDGVTAMPVDTTNESIDVMYELMRQTAEGQWSLRPKQYLARYWKSFSESGQGQMFFAYFEGQVVAASFGILIGKNGTYKDGASVRKRTAYGSSHLLQWEMMKWMKSRGVIRYDLCGVPASDRLDDPSHYLHGVGRFKTSFNKQVTDFVGAFELPVSPFKFKLWKLIVERIVLRLHRKLHAEEWY